MPTLKEFAKTYESKKTKNISELSEVPIDLDLKLDTFTDNKGEDISYNYVELNGERYRVPNSVVADLKQILVSKPDCTKVKVSKTGSGLGTKYTVIPLN